MTQSVTLNVDVPDLTIQQLEIAGDPTALVELELIGQPISLVGGITIRRLKSGSTLKLSTDITITNPNRWSISGGYTVQVGAGLQGSAPLQIRGTGSGSRVSLAGATKQFAGEINLAQGQLLLSADAPQASFVFTDQVTLVASGTPPTVGSVKYLASGGDFYLELKQGLVTDHFTLAPSVYWNPILRGTTPRLDYPVITVRKQANLNDASCYPLYGYSAQRGDLFTLIEGPGANPIMGRISQGRSVEDGGVMGFGPFWQVNYYQGKSSDLVLTHLDWPPKPAGTSINLYPPSLTAATSQLIQLHALVQADGRVVTHAGIDLFEGNRRLFTAGLFPPARLHFPFPGTYTVHARLQSSNTEWAATSGPVVITITNGPGYTVLPLPRWVPNVQDLPPPQGRGIRSLSAGKGRIWFLGDLYTLNTRPEAYHLGWLTPDGRIGYSPLSEGPSQFGVGFTRILSTTDDSIWFGDYAQFLWRHASNGAITRFDFGQGRGPLDLVHGPDGAMWAAQSGTASGNSFLVRLGADNSRKQFSVPVDFGFPTSLAIGPDNAIWMTTRSRVLGRMTTNGVFESVLLPKGNFPTVMGGLVKAANGTLWVDLGGVGFLGLDTSRNWHFVSLPSWWPTGVMPGLTAHPDGSVWFSGSGKFGRLSTNHTITLFNPPGIFGTLTTTTNGMLVASAYDQFCLVSPIADTAARSVTGIDLLTLKPAGIRSFLEAVEISVAVRSVGGTIPTGTVEFRTGDGTTQLVELADGRAKAMCRPNVQQPLSINYWGDRDHFACQMRTLDITTESATIRSTALLTGAPSSVGVGLPIVLRPRVLSLGNSPAEVDGNITVEADGAVLTTEHASTVEIPIVLEAPGVHRIDVHYDGSTDLDPARSIPLFVEAVSPTPISSTVVLTASRRAGAESVATLQAHVDHLTGKPGGLMHFYDGGLLIGSSVVQDGNSSLRFGGIGHGEHRFVAEYTGDRSFSAATSPEISFSVGVTDPPVLRASLDGASLVLRWPAAGQFVLQTSANAFGGPWQDDANAIQEGSELVARIPAPRVNTFFRLRE